jgi:hypothetical protein
MRGHAYSTEVCNWRCIKMLRTAVASGGGLLRVQSGLGAVAIVQHAGALESLAESS